MCRLLGIVASELTEFSLGLTGAPRCLATLSRDHRDGWGIAIHDAATTWDLHRGTAPAGDDQRFHELATKCRGHVLVAHVRQKTVGPTRLENTHPFVESGWAFAHNGTIQQIEALREDCSATRLEAVLGDTDSELFFAYVLTRLDEEGLVRLDDESSRARAADVLHEMTARLRERKIGAFNFLLSDGTTTFAHRSGRSLFILERNPADPVRQTRDMGGGATVVTAWTSRRQAVLIASEHTTDEPWQEVPDGTLLRIERLPAPYIVAFPNVGQREAS
ncbi:MAG TPA: class II glutamine amidotransferase [Labilithrix sp.]|jgi:glutamine amidotransferase|nr:class II glutamine amidotransferase [Labilithrix sp.]